MCEYDCAQLSYTVQYRTDMIIFCLILKKVVTEQMSVEGEGCPCTVYNSNSYIWEWCWVACKVVEWCCVEVLMRRTMKTKISVQKQRHNVRRSEGSRIMPEKGIFVFNIDLTNTLLNFW